MRLENDMVETDFMNNEDNSNSNVIIGANSMVERNQKAITNN